MSSSYLTIIVPVYNASAFLEECLESVRKQSFTDWRCFVVNDGSTDNSQRIIDSFCQLDSRFIGFVKENEKSADLARRYALQYVETPCVMHVDADDVIETDYIERLVARKKETGANAVVGRFIGCKDNLSGVDYCIPVESFDMTSIVSGPVACSMTIGGWQLSANNGFLYELEMTKGVRYGQYMNSDEFSQRQLVYNAATVAFEDAHYLYRSNEGISEAMSPRLFDRAMVDTQLVAFVYERFSSREDLKAAITKQKFFNLLHLTSDFIRNKSQFNIINNERISDYLKESYNCLNLSELTRFLPKHRRLFCNGWVWFQMVSLIYTFLKKLAGKHYYYK